MAAGEALSELSMGWGDKKIRVAVAVFSFQTKISQPGSLNILVSGNKLTQPLFPLCPPLIVSFFILPCL